MVSKASEDLPDPDSPVITTSWSRGRSTSMFLRLCTRAPRTEIQSWPIPDCCEFSGKPKPTFYTSDAGVPGVRGSKARGWRPSDLRAAQAGLPVAVRKVDDDADSEPEGEPLPGLARE